MGIYSLVAPRSDTNSLKRGRSGEDSNTVIALRSTAMLMSTIHLRRIEQEMHKLTKMYGNA